MMRADGMERPAHLIASLRTDRGLTQAEACRLAGVSRRTWSALESAAGANPRPATKVRVARALGVTPSHIWRVRPRPLHLEDVHDARWEPAVRRLARRLEREGSAQERRRLGEQLAYVLDTLDAGGREQGLQRGRWDELWELAGSLAGDVQSLPIAIVDGRLVESEEHSLTTSSSVAARRRRANAGRARRARR
jgi:transcriptional regulator with XRE-family HTH domain